MNNLSAAMSILKDKAHAFFTHIPTLYFPLPKPDILRKKS